MVKVNQHYLHNKLTLLFDFHSDNEFQRFNDEILNGGQKRL